MFSFSFLSDGTYGSGLPTRYKLNQSFSNLPKVDSFYLNLFLKQLVDWIQDPQEGIVIE